MPAQHHLQSIVTAASFRRASLPSDANQMSTSSSLEFLDDPLEENVGLLSMAEKNVHDGTERPQKVSKSLSKQSENIFGRIRAAVVFLVPSFFFARQVASSSLRSTAFLDGMRGVAALSVMNQHLAACLWKSWGSNWGQDDEYYFFMRLPGLSLLYGGHFAVSMFFVISGFALSLGPIQAMRKSPLDPGTAMKKLASATFRRPIRLFLPAFVSTALVLVLLRLHYMSSIAERVGEFEAIMDSWFPIKDSAPEYLPTLWLQLIHWARQSMNLLVIFSRL